MIVQETSRVCQCIVKQTFFSLCKYFIKIFFTISLVISFVYFKSFLWYLPTPKKASSFARNEFFLRIVFFFFHYLKILLKYYIRWLNSLHIYTYVYLNEQYSQYYFHLRKNWWRKKIIFFCMSGARVLKKRKKIIFFWAHWVSSKFKVDWKA